jgi:hypothetical protein
MKHWLFAGIMAASGLLLAGCSTPPVVRSNVTTFHALPGTLQDKLYVFERTKDQDNNLEYRNYENLVRGQLNRLGFTEAPEGKKPALKASLDYNVSVRDMRVVYPVAVDPYWPGPYGPRPYWRGYRRPYYDPFWYGPPIVEQREANYELYTRRLQVTLAQLADGKKIYETTVLSEGQNPSLAAVMPYMVRSAFTDFPGQSGVPRIVEMPMEQ